MKLLLIICGLVVLTQAAPEPQSGYNYPPPPSSRYGPPSGRQGHFGGQPSDDGDFGNSAFGASGSGAPGPNSHFGGSGLNSGSGGGYSGSRNNGGWQSSSHDEPQTIQKHIYVHVPPPEHHEHKPRQHIHFPPPQKHYKIIFIKAPPPPTPTAPEIPPIPQDEEKTLVYVLVKKPEEQPDIKIPTPVPTQPSSPEVYFIRYRTEKEESHGHSGYPQGGGYQGGSFQSSYSSGSSRSSSHGSSAGVSGQYGPPSGH